MFGEIQMLAFAIIGGMLNYFTNGLSTGGLMVLMDKDFIAKDPKGCFLLLKVVFIHVTPSSKLINIV